jgi:hypothetical protein
MIKFVIFERRFDFPGADRVPLYILNGPDARRANKDNNYKHSSGNKAQHHTESV